MNNQPENLPAPDQGPVPYKLYEDPALLAAVNEGDAHLRLALEGYKRAEEIATKLPDNQALKTVLAAAELSVRDWIKRQGLLTEEPKTDEDSGLSTP